MTQVTPWLSIVTVIKNDRAGLQQTLESLERHDLSDVEWIVVDSSDDATEVADLLTDVAITPDVHWIAPSGVFEAMNFGLEQATGYYAYFLNAGDELLPDALEEVRAAATSSDPAWIVAPVVLHELSGAVTVTQKLDFPREQATFFSRGRFANHQGTFVRTELLRQLGGFTTGYVVAADYEMFLQLVQTDLPEQIDTPVARFTEGGVSTQRWLRGWFEFGRARQSVFGLRGKERLAERLRSVTNLAAMSWHRSPWPLIGALLILSLVLLWSTGAPLLQALSITGAVALQSFAGSVWWRTIRRTGPVSILETVGMGLVLGTAASMLVGLWLPWWIAPLVLITGWLIFRHRGQVAPMGRLTLAESVGLGVGLVPGILSLVHSMRSYPLTWNGIWSGYHGDMTFFEGLAASVAKLGPGPSLFMEGADLRYHSLVYGWAGQLTVSLDLMPFLVLVRVLPILVLIGSVSLAVSWAHRLSPGYVAPGLAALLVVSGGFVGATFGTILNFDSPSQAMTTMWLLGLSIVVLQALRGGHPAGYAIPTVTLSLAIAGGKISTAAIAVAGIAVLSLLGVVRQASWRWRALGLFLATAFSTLVVYVTLLAGSNDSGGLKFLALVDRASSLQSLNPVVTERGILAGIVILVVAVLPRWLGMAWLIADVRDRWSPDTVLGYGYALGALGTILVLSGGFNDLWFTVAASAPLAVLSAAGVAGGWSCLSQISWNRNLSSLILGAFSALLAVLLWTSGSSGILGIGWRWAAPLAALTALALGAIVIAARSSLSPWRTWLAVFVIAGVAAAVPSRFIYAVAARVETTYPTSTSTVLFSPPSFDKAWRGGERGGWSDSEALAGEWLRRNALPTDLLATNVTSSALVTALTRLPTYVSAIRFQSAYGRADDYPKIETRERASWEFIDNPSLATAFPLCEAGVDWLWIDPRVSSSVTWEPFADVRFAEDDVVILEFNSELCPK